MKFWLVCLAGVFGMTELYHWLQGLTLPVPFYGAAGLLLALLSNANHWAPRFREATQIESGKLATWMEPQIGAENEMGESQAEEIQMPSALHSPQARTPAEPQLPNFPGAAPPSISFTVRKS
jgi:hypothetical protein